MKQGGPTRPAVGANGSQAGSRVARWKAALRRRLPASRAPWRGEHLLFGVALGALLLLGLWWTRLLASSVGDEASLARASLALQVERAARDPSLRGPALRVVPEAEGSALATPVGGGLMLDVAPEVLAAVDERGRRRRLMVVGEGTLLLFLLGVTTVMLYRLIGSRAAVEREMGYFVGQMTHEMKTPLAGLRALLETLGKGRIDPAELPELVALGLQQVEREEHLVMSLLQAQRLRVSREPLHPEPLRLGELLQRFVDHRGVPGLSGSVDGEPVVRADRDAIWTILENLVDNALKFEAQGVRLRAWTEGRRAFVSCEDDGIGFAPERAGELFRPFRSAHSDGGSRHGSGLGLFLCRRLARAMGGELTGRSAGAGQGATFVLQLRAETP